MKTCILLLLFTLSLALKAQFSIQNVLSPPFPTELKASNNGQFLVWVFNDRGERNIFVSVSPFDQSKKVTSFSGDEGLELGQLNISADGQRMAFVRGNAVNSRGEAANPAFLQIPTGQQIWIMDRDGGHLRIIGPGSSPSISPDGRQMVYLHRGEVWISDLNDTAKTVQKLFQSRGTMTQLRWSPDGNMLAFVSNRVDHSFVGIYDFSLRSVYFVQAGVDRDQYFACGVDIHGVHNWNDEIPTFAPWYDAAKFPAFAKTALESSPVHYSKSWIRPVLFIHGDDDRNVPFSETVNMIQQLRKQGVHTESLVLPDEVHGFLMHKNWLKVYEASFEFIDRQMTTK